MISICFQVKPFNITVIQVYALTSNTEEAEKKWSLLVLATDAIFHKQLKRSGTHRDHFVPEGFCSSEILWLTKYNSLNVYWVYWFHCYLLVIRTCHQMTTTAGRNPSEEMEWPSRSTEESEMQYLDAISKMTEWSLFIPRQTIQYHGNPSLCPDQ